MLLINWLKLFLARCKIVTYYITRPQYTIKAIKYDGVKITTRMLFDSRGFHNDS